ncbi:MAG TPA: hypothetical protein PKD63_04445 [Solirubrobacteraceae bacterium]|nr:hypothetical protein [Solirubrobacteraceae bacterium]
MLLLPVVTTLLLTLIHAAVAQAERWHPPLREAAVVREFDFDARTPFARGAHRGVRLGGGAGAVVVAPCSGRVTFAGRHPRLGPGLTLRCGRLVATAFGLEPSLPRRGALLAAGTRVGTLGPQGVLYLGARRAADRRGYRDPLALITAAPAAPVPLAPAPRRLHRPAPPRHTRRAPPPAPPRSGSAPVVAWAGLALAGVGAGLGVTVRRHARRSRRRPAVSGQPTH